MAVISLNIPDAVIQRVIDALCAQGQYVSGVSGNKTTFAKQQLVNYVMQAVANYEVGVATKTASDTAKATVISEIVIT